MKHQRAQIQKGDDEGKVHRLSEIEPQFVSLVTAGANRQTKFQVVKEDEKVSSCKECNVAFVDGACPECGGEIAKGTTPGTEDKDHKSAESTGNNDDDSIQNKRQDDGDTDVSAWLDSASESTDELYADSVLSVKSPASQPASVDKKAETGEPRNRPSVKWAKEKKALTEKLKMANARADAAESKNVALKRELRTSKTSLAKFRRGVGGSTAIVCGDLSGKIVKGDVSENSGPLWAAGGDMAAEIG